MSLQPVVIYDGECRFCQWSLRRIRKLDRDGLFEYLPRQAQEVDERFPRLSESDFNTGLRFIRASDEIRVGADALYEIYRRLPIYRHLAWVYRLPILRQLIRAGYAFVARNRHRFGRVECDTGSCAAGSDS